MPQINNLIEAKKLAKFMQKLANHLEEVERANNTRESARILPSNYSSTVTTYN